MVYSTWIIQLYQQKMFGGNRGAAFDLTQTLVLYFKGVIIPALHHKRVISRHANLRIIVNKH